jgi:hypothetical protein
VTAGSRHRLVRTLGRHGLASPTRLLLDAHRPLEPLLADLGAAIGPLLATVTGRSVADDALRDLETPGAVDRLIAEIDDHDRGSRGADAG